MTDGTNPWLSRPADPEPEAPTVTESLLPRPTGPLAPQRGVPAPERIDQLPIYDQPRSAELWWLGTHGGAAESSLASLVPGWQAAGHGWPRQADSAPARVVLTARSNMRGLTTARSAATQWAAGMVPHVEVLGLVLVTDAPGRLPRPLRDFAQVVGGGLPRMWTVPWIESWRLGEPLALSDAPRAVRHLVDELHALMGLGANSTTD